MGNGILGADQFLDDPSPVPIVSLEEGLETLIERVFFRGYTHVKHGCFRYHSEFNALQRDHYGFACSIVIS